MLLANGGDASNVANNSSLVPAVPGAGYSLRVAGRPEPEAVDPPAGLSGRGKEGNCDPRQFLSFSSGCYRMVNQRNYLTALVLPRMPYVEDVSAWGHHLK